jgi:membrane protein implicated in regulation of membrane protease activity
MKEIIQLLLFLILCLTTFFISKKWLEKYGEKSKIVSIDNKMNFGKLIIVHISNVKTLSLILIGGIILRIIYLLLVENVFI